MNNSTTENDFDMQALFRILNALLFKIDTKIDNILDIVEKVDFKDENYEDSQFYLTKINRKNYKNEIAKMEGYLDKSSEKLNQKSPECNSEWLIHNSTYVRGYIISHILKWFYRFLGTDNHEEYNEHKDFNIIPKEAIYEAMIFLHKICWVKDENNSFSENQQFSNEIVQLLKQKTNESLLNRSSQVVEIPIEEEKQFFDLSKNNSTIFGVMKGSIDMSYDESNFDSFKTVIDELINITPSQEKVKQEMSMLLKSIDLRWLTFIHQILERNRKVLNSMTKDTESLEKCLIESSQNLKYPKIDIDDSSYKNVVQFVNSKWAEQVKHSFYYYEDDEECISRWMQNMMKDRTSFWFDTIKYQEIRCDYKEVRNSFGDDKNKSTYLYLLIKLLISNFCFVVWSINWIMYRKI